MSDFAIRKDDLLPILNVSATLSSGAPFDMTGASSARFKMRGMNDTTFKVDAPATIVSAVGGTLRYTWISGDTDDPNVYYGWFVLTYPGGNTITVPTEDAIPIIVNDT